MVDFSFIIPTYNEENYIKECLKSIRRQEGNISFEVILSDCYSEDKTVRIAEEFADKIVYSEKKDIGLARNKGASVAAGKYLIFMDADTIIPSDFLLRLKNLVGHDRYIGFTCSFYFSHRPLKFRIIERIVKSYYWIRDKLTKAYLLGYTLIIVKREIFEKVGGFDVDAFSDDSSLSSKLRKIGRIKYLSSLPVYTSPRRLEKMGVIGTVIYYWGLKKGHLKNRSFKERYIKV